ncbi:hypothetical protein E2C01_072967 [Portunus trituberculatus]|uniref:Uncharacterized protein n=1 Tax=Portunus trituberculatus TaxID=210409 RepID=A0A5B7I1I4_PORTR|nr:hypothetical protein [Portunus trituberculatus]
MCGGGGDVVKCGGGGNDMAVEREVEEVMSACTVRQALTVTTSAFLCIQKHLLLKQKLRGHKSLPQCAARAAVSFQAASPSQRVQSVLNYGVSCRFFTSSGGPAAEPSPRLNEAILLEVTPALRFLNSSAVLVTNAPAPHQAGFPGRETAII